MISVVPLFNAVVAAWVLVLFGFLAVITAVSLFIFLVLLSRFLTFRFVASVTWLIMVGLTLLRRLVTNGSLCAVTAVVSSVSFAVGVVV